MSSLLLTKLAAQLILPPGGLILLGLAGLIFWRKWWGRMLVLLSFACLWLLSTEPVRDALTWPLEFQSPALNISEIPAGTAAIVLLGGGVYEKAPEYGGQDELGSHAMMRTIYAVKLARATGMDIYATGGRPLSHAFESEGEIMRRWLIWLGLPARMVHAEISANNTWENARYIRGMLEKRDIHRVVLIASAFHMPRAVWCFKKNGLDVIAAPVDYLTRRTAYDPRSYFPQWGVFDASGRALNEYLGLLWYRLRYG